MSKVAIIGAGNMGGAIARGLLKSGAVPAENITISDILEENLEKLRAVSSDWRLTTSNLEAISEAEVIILAVKPWFVADVANTICPRINFQSQIIVSIAAGVEIAELKKYFDADAPIFRVIPNTAIEVLESVSTIAYENANDEQKNKISAIFNPLGKIFFIDESNLNAFMSLSSCGIAYAFRYIRAAMEGGVEMGIYPNTAQEVVVQTLKGAIKLLETNRSHPEIEIDKVTTPGGITIKGLNEMEANGFTNAVVKGLKKSLL